MTLRNIAMAGFSLLLAVVLHVNSSNAQAAAIPISNPSFETATGGVPDDWTFTPSAGGYFVAGQDTSLSNEFVNGGYTGSAIGFIYWSGGGPGNSGTGTVSQVLSQTAQADTTYTLSVDIGYRDDGPGGYGDTIPAPQGIFVKLFAGASELSGGVYLTPTLKDSGFVTYTSTYTIGATAPLGNLQVEIIGTETSPATVLYNPHGYADRDEAYFGIDNVNLTATPVPEPSSIVAFLGLAGMAGLAVTRRAVHRKR